MTGAEMSPDPSHDLIDELVARLEPVRPIAPIGRRLALLLAVPLPVALVAFAVYGLPQGRGGLLGDLPFTGVLVGLALAALGACTSALASVVPGRETLQRVAGGLALLGLAMAVGVGAVRTPWGQAAHAGALTQSLVCIGHGVLFAGLPILAALLLAARGWSGRPGVTVVSVLVGGGAAGALIVHLICPATSAFHVLCAHTSTPLLLAAGLGALLAPAMRRWAR